ncbi:hypothetical protein LTR95_004762 [Oleoguttula sp. CCFEE 5521]
MGDSGDMAVGDDETAVVGFVMATDAVAFCVGVVRVDEIVTAASDAAGDVELVVELMVKLTVEGVLEVLDAMLLAVAGAVAVVLDAARAFVAVLIQALYPSLSGRFATITPGGSVNTCVELLQSQLLIPWQQ